MTSQPRAVAVKPAAATYCRISRDKRKDEAGIERQQADTDALARKLGYRVVERIVDNDRSASRRKRRRREGFDHLLELVQSGRIDAAIVYNLDRFTRNPDELGAWIAAAELNPNVRIITTGEILDLSDDDHIFRARILLAVAEKESANTAKRVKRQAQDWAEKGKPRWNVRPFGFELDGSHVPVEAAEVRAIYADVIAGRSMTSIALDLNTRGVVNPSGARWQSATIGFMVRRARNAGLRDYNGKIVGKATWEPIVTEEVWRQAVAALDARGRLPAARSLLGGLVRCAHCGATMKRSARSYRCMPSGDGYRKATTCRVIIAADALDRHVTGLVLACLGTTRPRRSKQPTGGTDRLRGEVVKIQADLEALAGMMGRRELTMGEWKAAKAGLDARMATATSELTHVDARAALERMAGPTATLAERWDDLDVALRSRIVGTVIESVVVGKATCRGRQAFSLDRIDVRWASAD